MHLAMDDWTRRWSAAGLALSAWTREPRLLADPRAARLLELSLELVVLRHRLVLRGYVVLPGALHVVAARSADASLLPWPVAFGRARAAFARWWNVDRGGAGALWRERVRVAPLPTAADVAEAVARCHRAPVLAGLAAEPSGHAASSWHALHGQPRRAFVTPPGERRG